MPQDTWVPYNFPTRKMENSGSIRFQNNMFFVKTNFLKTCSSMDRETDSTENNLPCLYSRHRHRISRQSPCSCRSVRGGGRPSPDCRSPGLTYPVCLSGHHIYHQSHESSLKCHKRNTEKTVKF